MWYDISSSSINCVKLCTAAQPWGFLDNQIHYLGDSNLLYDVNRLTKLHANTQKIFLEKRETHWLYAMVYPWHFTFQCSVVCFIIPCFSLHPLHKLWFFHFPPIFSFYMTSPSRICLMRTPSISFMVGSNGAAAACGWNRGCQCPHKFAGGTVTSPANSWGIGDRFHLHAATAPWDPGLCVDFLHRAFLTLKDLEKPWSPIYQTRRRLSVACLDNKLL